MSIGIAVIVASLSIFVIGLWVVALNSLWEWWRHGRSKESKIIVYTNLIHRHGVGSKQTLAYLEENKGDETFLRRAEMLDKLKNLANEDWDAILNTGDKK